MSNGRHRHRHHSSNHKHSGKNQAHSNAPVDAKQTIPAQPTYSERLEKLTTLIDSSSTKISAKDKTTYVSQIERLQNKLSLENSYGNVAAEIELLEMAVNSDEHVKTISKARGKIIKNEIDTETLDVKGDEIIQLEHANSNVAPKHKQTQARPGFFARWCCCAEVIEDANEDEAAPKMKSGR